MEKIRMAIFGLGLALFLYGAGAVCLSFVKPVKTTMQWYGSVAAFMISGAGLSAGSIFLGKQKETTMLTNNVTKILPDKIELEAKQLADFECLNHLTTRFNAAKDVDGIELCRKLQDRMFELHHGKIEQNTTS